MKNVFLQWFSKKFFFVAAPTRVNISYSTICNGRCVYCHQDKEDNKNILKAEEIISCLEQLKKVFKGGFFVTLIGGEPLIYKDFLKILAFAKEKGIKVNFTTNAFLLTQETIDKIIETRPFSISLSIDALDPDISQQLRPRGKRMFDPVIAAENLIRARANHRLDFNINIKSVVTDLNYADIKKLITRLGKTVMFTLQPVAGKEFNALKAKNRDDFAREIENIIALKKEGFFINNSVENLREMVDYFFKDNPDMEKKRQPCDLGYHTLFIGNDGNLSLCLTGKTGRPIGNIRNHSIEESWFGQSAKTIRKEMWDCKRHCDLSCTRKVSFSHKAYVFLNLLRKTRI
jgi:MoaA/NifB/PqqE/SkfB family radical SAM enzyme